jgi:hypothetical protein
MKKLHLLTLVALIMLGLSGCEKGKVTNEATADVFVKTIKNAQGATVYAIIHTVFSYNGISSVKVTSPDGTISQLSDPEGSGFSFYNNPLAADYLPTFPTTATGNYTYLVKFKDGEEITYTNSLTSSFIAPANITTLAKTVAGDSVYLRWDAIPNVQFYQVEILRGTQQIYSSDKFYDPATPKKANLRIGFLYNSLTASGTGNFTFNINGLLYETTAYDYLQGISLATRDIAL